VLLNSLIPPLHNTPGCCPAASSASSNFAWPFPWLSRTTSHTAPLLEHKAVHDSPTVVERIHAPNGVTPATQSAADVEAGEAVVVAASGHGVQGSLPEGLYEPSLHCAASACPTIVINAAIITVRVPQPLPPLTDLLLPCLGAGGGRGGGVL
jgi:hypothetical protein